MKNLLIAIMLVAALPSGGRSFAATVNVPSEKPAVVLAVFGTSRVAALPGIMDIFDSVRRALPGIEVRLAFTSSIIRRIWRDRQHDQDFLAAHPEVPGEVLTVKGALAAIADLQDEGYGYIIVQPTHIANGEEYTDLRSYIDALNSIRTVKKRNMPFKKVAIGRPVFGVPGLEHEYRQDIERAAGGLAGDAAAARQRGAALVYMGHGNAHFSTGVYQEFVQVMRRMYPDVRTYLTMVEGFPSHELLLPALAEDGVEKVYLKALMTVAGVHAREDMAGEGDHSLKSLLEARGIAVEVDLQGLGEHPEFAAIFIANIRDAARDIGLDLE